MDYTMTSKAHQLSRFTQSKTISGSFLSLIYLISLAAYYLDRSGTLKYFQYLLPMLGLFVSMEKIHKTWSSSGELAKLCNILLLLAFINLCVVLARGVFYFRFIQEGFLFLGALVFTITLVGNYASFIPKYIETILYVLIGVFIVDKSSALLHVLLNPVTLLLGFISSDVPTESSLSFYFAVLSLYFVIEKDKTKALISIIFMVLSFKRIACSGFLLSLLLYNVLTIFKIGYNRKLYSIALASINFVYLWSLILLVNGDFDEFISNTFGVSANFLFMGRVDMYTNIFSKLGYVDIFGLGIGRVSDFLSNYDESGIGEGILTNLHSDILKYYLELGVVGFVIFLYNFIYYLSKNLINFCFMVMLNIIFLTDNVSIYFCFMVLFFLVNYKFNNSIKLVKQRKVQSKEDPKLIVVEI